MSCRSFPALLFAALVALPLAAKADVFNMPSGDTSLQFVTVGNPGNAGDTAVMVDSTHATGFGSVGYTYQMGQYDVTAAQYTQFLNAVAATDTYGLYNTKMATGTGNKNTGCGILQSTNPDGTYSYSVTKNGNYPVNYVTWGDAARFCNWLQNGQPTGAEDNSTTEAGAYTLNGAVLNSSLALVTRNPGAQYYIPNENEWYKAAYYDPSLNGGAGGYWAYPTMSNSAPGNSLALALTTSNEANYYTNGTYTDSTNYLTPVGTFSQSPSAYGTFDQGGDVMQWTETLGPNFGPTAFDVRAEGAFSSSYPYLGSSYRTGNNPANGIAAIGFRVAEAAAVPEPGSITLLVVAVAGLWWWKRRR